MVDGAKVGADGHFLAAIDIAAFEEPTRFRARVDGIVDEVRRSRPGPGTRRLLAPGEIEAEFEEAYARDGILLAGGTVDGIAAEAARFGIDASTLFRQDQTPWNGDSARGC